MTDPVLGNKAEEQAQFEQGKDFSVLNRSSVGPGDDLRIKFADEDGELALRPDRPEPTAQTGAISLDTTQNHQLMSQLIEEPEQLDFVHPSIGHVITSNSRMARAQARNRNREELIWYGIRPKMLFAALDLPLNSNARVVVRMDSMESEYSCQHCHGTGHTGEACKAHAEFDCGHCLVLGFGRETKHSSGFTICANCRGTGWRGGIIIPEIAQNLPVTGIVVSLGPNTMVCKLGDRVLHSRYAGHNIDTPEKERFTIMRESEILGLIRDK
jgi:co-chaperonin GroES (HSP10)